jgi:uncharacterized protein YndB with AHSA1/START domain
MTKPDENARSIELEIEVAGTPEQVWRAIATGEGISAWFIPAEVDEREGGTLSLDMGTGMEAVGRVTDWDPPRRFAYEEEQPVQGRPSARLATEFLVEARSGGTCVVRLVSNLFGIGSDWDNQLDEMETGWTDYLYVLRTYLGDFPGQPCSTVFVTGNAQPPSERAWAAFSEALGFPSAAVGDRVVAGAGTPPLAGGVERVGDTWLVLRVDDPAPGMAVIGAYGWKERVFTSVHLYLYGEEAPPVAERETRAWQAWMDERFPAAVPSGPA